MLLSEGHTTRMRPGSGRLGTSRHIGENTCRHLALLAARHSVIPFVDTPTQLDDGPLYISPVVVDWRPSVL